ncbi:MAG TPA: hypothetical protein VN238_06785 [Solirubrobacteraceae bacterium]|nr:hypothetical protein [Solirubrobacteraceae bacterium]
MLRPTLLSAAALSALALGATGSASAATVTYDVHIDATVAYDHERHSESRTGSTFHVSDTSWHLGGKLTSVLPMVRFVDGRAEESGNGIVEEAISGRYVSAQDSSSTGPQRLECLADGRPSPWGRSSIVPAGFADSGRVAVRLTDLLEVTANCDDGRNPGSTIAKLDGDVDDPTGGPFDAVFDLPPDALGNQLIAQLEEGAVQGEHCPGYDEHTVSCKLSWTATISFVRSDVAGTVDPIKQPPPPATGTNDTLGQNAADVIARELERQRREREQQERADQAKADAVSKAVKDYLDQERIADTIRKVLNPGASNGPNASVDLSCPGACTGSVTVKAGKATLAKGTLRPLGRSSAATAKGTYGVRAKLRFDRADRRAAKRAGKVTLTFAVRVGTGAVQRVTTTVKLGGKRR